MKTKQPEDNMELEVMRAFASRKTDQEMGMPDVEQELSHLRAGRNGNSPAKGSHRGLLSPLRKVAAILVVALMLTGLSYAAVRTSFFTQNWNEDKAQVTEVKTADANPTEQHTTYTPEIKIVGDSVILFKDFRLDSIMMQIDRYYQVESQFLEKESRGMRLLFKWNRQHSLEEVLERMNGFERFKVRREENKLIVEQNAVKE